jgi:hypothetical protein
VLKAITKWSTLTMTEHEIGLGRLVSLEADQSEFFVAYWRCWRGGVSLQVVTTLHH